MAALVRICRLASCTTVKRLNNSLSFSRSLHAASCANLITRTSQKGRITGVLARHVATDAAVRSTEPPERSDRPDRSDRPERFQRFERQQQRSDGPLTPVDRHLEALDRQARNRGRVAREDVEETIAAVNAAGEVSSQQTLMVMRSMGALLVKETPDVRHEMFQRFWESLPQLGVKLNVSHYNVALRVQLENGQKFKVAEFLAEMEKNTDIIPNRITYQLLIARYCEDGDVEGASKVLEHMKSQDMAVNESIFNALVKGHMINSDVAGAKEVIASMKKAGLEPSANTYKQLLCGYAAQSNMDGIKQVLAEAAEDDVYLSASHLFEVIFQLGRLGQADMMAELITVVKTRHGYNQDAANCMFRLVALGHDEAAYQTYMSMQRPLVDTEANSLGRILLRSMLIAGRPMETIMDFSERLSASGLMTTDLNMLAIWALKFEKPEHAMYIFNKMQEQDSPVKAHYFWPVFKTYEASGNKQGIYTAIKSLDSLVTTDLQKIVTLYYFALRPLSKLGDDEATVVDQMTEIGISSVTINSAKIVQHVSDGRFSEAVDLIQSSDGLLPLTLLKSQIAYGFQKSEQDFPNVIELLCCADKLSEQKLLDLNSTVLTTLLSSGQLDTQQTEQLMADWVDKDLKIMNRSMNPIMRALQAANVGAETLASLSKLSAVTGDRPYVPASSMSAKDYMLASIPDLETMFTDLKARKGNTKAVEKWLLSKYCAAGDVEKAGELKASLDDQGFVYNPELLRQLGFLAARFQADLPLALQYKQQMETRYPDFSAYVSLVLHIAVLQIQDNKVQDAVQTITDYASRCSARLADYTDGHTLGTLCELMLTAAREHCTADDTKTLMNALFDLGYLKKGTFSLLSQNIGVNIDRGNMDGMLEALGDAVNQYGKAPMFSEVFRLLIQNQDTERLQKAVDLVSMVHGEMSVLLHLVISFIECDKPKQARKILETPGLRAVMPVLKDGCARFYKRSMAKEMDLLAEVTKDLFAIDRDEMLFNQIRLYAKLDDHKKALDVYVTFEEENVVPRVRTMRYLANVLTSHQQTVPFEVPTVPSSSGDAPSDLLTPLQKLAWTAVKTGDIDQFVLLRKQAADKGEAFGTELLASFGKSVAQSNTIPQFKRYVHELSDLGELDSLLLLRQNTMSAGKNNFLHQRILRAYVIVGRAEELLDHLIANPTLLHTYMSTKGILLLADRQPQLFSKLETAIARYTEESGQTKAVIHLFNAFCLTEQFEKAERLLAQHPSLKREMRVIFLCNEASSQQKESTLKKLTEILDDSSKQSLAIPFSHLIRLKCDQDAWREALAYYTAATARGVALPDFWKVAMASLERLLTDNKQPLPWPAGTFLLNQQDETSDSSDSSSSDSDNETSSPR